MECWPSFGQVLYLGCREDLVKPFVKCKPPSFAEKFECA